MESTGQKGLISQRHDLPTMLVLGKKASWKLFFQTNPIISQI